MSPPAPAIACPLPSRPVFVVASLTDPIVEFATNVVADLGLTGIFILMLLESACIPIPSEATMLFAGFNVSKGEYSLVAVTLVGSVANLVGSWVAYAVGYYGRVDILEKHGDKNSYNCPAEISIGLNPKVTPTGWMRTDKKMYATSHIGMGDTMAKSAPASSRSTATDPKVPSYEGGKFPLSTYLAERVRAMVAAIGDPRESDTLIGPLIDEDNARRVEEGVLNFLDQLLTDSASGAIETVRASMRQLGDEIGGSNERATTLIERDPGV